MKRKERVFIFSQALIAAAVLALVALPLQGQPTAPAQTSSQTATSTSTWTTFSTSGSDGLRLELQVNSTSLQVGQQLGITIELTNLLPTPLNMSLLSLPTNASGLSTWWSLWQFYGFPVAVWDTCTVLLPLQFVVIQGNFTSQDVGTSANDTRGILGWSCADTQNVQNIVFQPGSDVVNMNAVFVATKPATTYTGPSDQYRMASTFAVDGYWNESAIQMSELYSTPSGPNATAFAYPERSPTGATPFSPGVYTLAVSDEWGQVEVVDFAVT